MDSALDMGNRRLSTVAASQPAICSTAPGRYVSDRTEFWRKRRDSNPRYAFTYTHFPGVRLKPLGHPSASGRSYPLPAGRACRPNSGRTIARARRGSSVSCGSRAGDQIPEPDLRQFYLVNEPEPLDPVKNCPRVGRLCVAAISSLPGSNLPLRALHFNEY